MATDITYKLSIDAYDSAKTLDDMDKSLVKMKDDLKKLEVGTKEFKTLSNAIRSAESEVKNLNKSFEGLDKEALTGEFGKLSGGITAAFTGIAALGGDANKSMEALISTVAKGMAIAQGFKGATEAMTAAQKVYNAVLKANPIGIIITAVTAFIGLVVALIANGDKVINMLDGWAEKFTFLQGPINIIKAGIQGLMDAWETVQRWILGDEAVDKKLAEKAEKIRLTESNKSQEWEIKRLEAIKASEQEIYNAKRKALEDRIRLAELNGQQETDEYRQMKIDLLALDANFNEKQKAADAKAAEDAKNARKKAAEDKKKADEESQKAKDDATEKEKERIQKEKEDAYSKLEWENDVALKRLELHGATDYEIYSKKVENYEAELELLKTQYGEESRAYIDHQLELEELKKTYSDKELKNLEDFRNRKKEIEDAWALEDAETEQEEYDLKVEQENERFEAELENLQLSNEEIELLKAEHLRRLKEMEDEHTQKVIDNAEKEKQEKIKNANAGLNAAKAALDVYSAALDMQMNKELKDAGDNEAKKEQIRKEYGKKKKAAAIIDAIIGTALAVMNALQMTPFPLGIAMSVIAGAMGAVQIATISSQQYAAGGILSGPSHAAGGISTPFGELEGGEAVINARSMASPSLRNLASSVNVAGGGKDFSTGDGSIKLSAESLELLASKINNKKVYVSETDITSTQNRVRVIENEATL